MGLGTIVSGVVVSGCVSTNAKLMLGPGISGKFALVRVNSIRIGNKSVRTATTGHYASFLLRFIGKVKDIGSLKHGKVLVDVKKIGKIVWEFSVEMVVLGKTLMKEGYQGVVNSCNIMQSANILNIDRG